MMGFLSRRLKDFNASTTYPEEVYSRIEQANASGFMADFLD
jgi:hypothetical protein